MGAPGRASGAGRRTGREAMGATSRRAGARSRAHRPAGGGRERKANACTHAEARGESPAGVREVRQSQARRQMALATRPRSTSRRSTSVIERSPRGCMGKEPANGAWACQWWSRTADRGGASSAGERLVPPRPELRGCEAHHETSVRPAARAAIGQVHRAPRPPFAPGHPLPVGNRSPGPEVSAAFASRALLTCAAVTQCHRPKSRESPAPGGGRARSPWTAVGLRTGPQFGPVVDLAYTRCCAPW